jgi:hypothetical protein
VSNIFYGPGGEIINDQDVVTALQVSIGKMRSDEASAACYEYTQILVSSKPLKISELRKSGKLCKQVKSALTELEIVDSDQL